MRAIGWVPDRDRRLPLTLRNLLKVQEKVPDRDRTLPLTLRDLLNSLRDLL
jgi:hypothetical protein